jgi:hypothetical protein
MTRQEIMDKYAQEQGYEDWGDLQSDHYGTSKQIRTHWECIIDLIQDELKNKIVKENSFIKGSLIKPKENDVVYTEHLDKYSILNTKNI